MNIKNLLLASALFGLSLCTTANANKPSNNDFIVNLKQEWATAKYQTPRNQQDKVFQELMDKSEIYAAKHPKDAQAALWHGTILATYASIKGGMGALKYASASKESLEKAIELDPSVGHGFGHAVLGSLYVRIPGWPIGFGDKTKGQNHLKMALKIDPEGIDSNFYYANYLVENQQYKAARPYLQKGLHAKTRPHFEVADQGRKQEIKKLLEAVQSN